MDNLNKRIQLENIEIELNELIRHDRRNWVLTAKLLLTIERDKLFEVRATSFSSYIRKLAYDNKINASTLWRIKSAAMLYMELSGMDSIEQLEEDRINATPEQLEIYKKVRSIVPEKIMENLKGRLLEGKKVRNELHKLWKVYKPLKNGQTERGRKKVGEELLFPENDQIYLPYSDTELQVNTAIEQKSLQQLNRDLRKIERFGLSTEDLNIANMLNALQAPYWLENTYGKVPLYKHEVFTKLLIRPPKNNRALPTDFMALTLALKTKKQIPDLTAVKLTLNIETLKRVKRDKILHHFCNFAYVAMLNKDELMSEALEILPSFIGILVIKEQLAHARHAIKTERIAEAKPVEDAHANSVHRAMLLRSLRWNNTTNPSVF